jgi:hypothetical protein
MAQHGAYLPFIGGRLTLEVSGGGRTSQEPRLDPCATNHRWPPVRLSDWLGRFRGPTSRADAAPSAPPALGDAANQPRTSLLPLA